MSYEPPRAEPFVPPASMFDPGHVQAAMNSDARRRGAGAPRLADQATMWTIPYLTTGETFVKFIWAVRLGDAWIHAIERGAITEEWQYAIIQWHYGQPIRINHAEGWDDIAPTNGDPQ